jgi:hypothetical protein
MQFGKRDYISPSLIIVGKVAGLHAELKWKMETEAGSESYFKPIVKNKEQEVRA